MPNHCHNRLQVIGPGPSVAAFLAKASSPDALGERGLLSFHPFVPYPEVYAEPDRLCRRWDDLLRAVGPTLRETVEREMVEQGKMPPRPPSDGYSAGGRQWCCEHWGTQWEPYDTLLEHLDGGVVFSFLTSWTPPLKAVIAMGEQHPDLALTLEYEERWGGLRGVLRLEGGAVALEHGGDTHPARGG